MEKESGSFKKGATVRTRSTGRIGIVRCFPDRDTTATVEIQGQVLLFFKKDLEVITKETHPELYI